MPAATRIRAGIINRTRNLGRRKAVLVAAVAAACALGLPLLTPTVSAAATAEPLSVNLASPTAAPNDVGEGFLYGLSQNGSSPADNYLEPLDITLMRGGGARIAGDGWIGDGYTDGIRLPGADHLGP